MNEVLVDSGAIKSDEETPEARLRTLERERLKLVDEIYGLREDGENSPGRSEEIHKRLEEIYVEAAAIKREIRG